jgi:ubiquinone/menaquinone biosynthesis C-methylase UbiE
MNFWNDEVYKKKLQWNMWPFPEVISTLLGLSQKNEFLGKSVLEVGCGVGNNIIPVARLGFKAYGIDISDYAILEAKKRSLQENVEIELLSGNIEKLPYESNFFSFVIDRSVLTCTSPEVITRSLDEILRVLKPGGIFMAFDWFGINHPDLRFGRYIDRNCFKDFKFGRFKNVELITSFDINTLKGYLQKFTHLDIKQIVSNNMTSEILTETYNFTACTPNLG